MTFNPTAPGTPTPTTIDGTQLLTAVACPSTSQCTAVDTKAQQVTFNPRAPGTPTPTTIDTGLAQLDGVACPSTSQCTAVDIKGQQVTFNPAAPGTPTPTTIDRENQLTGVACPSATFCVAVDQFGDAVVGNPANAASWTVEPIADAIYLTGVACSSVVQCVTVDQVGHGFVGSPPSANNFTWNGAAGSGEANWSIGGNWGGTAPNGEAPTLVFPKLVAACEHASPPNTCYTSTNNLTGLSVQALTIDDGSGYSISGNGFNLGSGGITASNTLTELRKQVPRLTTPITLTAPQTWSIDGNGAVQGQIEFAGNITGTSDALTVKLPHGGQIGVASELETGPVTFEGGTVFFSNGAVNAGDGHSVTAKNTNFVFGNNGPQSVGSLTVSGGYLDVFTGELGTLSVHGAVALEGGASYLPAINKAGTVAGTDYTQLSATGPVTLNGSNLTLTGIEFPGEGPGRCPILKTGDVDTIITSTGKVEGAFGNAADGATVEFACFGAPPGGTPPAAVIHYTEHSVTATITREGSVGSATQTTIEVRPTQPVTNQPVTLKATVTPNSPAPSGTVSFENHGTPIPGCENIPVALTGTAYAATCETPFTAASSPEALTAVFTPATLSGLAGSTSTVDNLTIGKDSTSTAIAVSNATPAVGGSVTYTATVTPAHAGALEPSGSVEFLDDGTLIEGCASQPLTPSTSSSTATCTLSYPAAGPHSITATYLADSNFTGSSSAPAQTVTVQSKSAGGPAPGEGSGSGATSGGGVLAFKSNVLPARETVTLASGTVMIRPNGTSTFVPLSGSSTIPDGSEVDATNGRVVITVTTPSGKTVTAEVYGGRFRLHQDSSGVARFILTLPLTGCPRVPLPHGSAASLAKHSGAKARHLWVSETGGSWGTNGRYVSTTVEGTTWLTVDECTRSEVKVMAGKVKVLDLVRRKTKTVSAGGSYVAKLTPKGRRK